MDKKYYFTVDYNTKYGIVKKGDWLTGRLSKSSNTPKVFFEFYEKTDKEKADAGEGTFSISEVDLKNFATDVEPVKNEKDKENTKEKGWKSWSNTKKGLVVGGVLLGLAGIVTAIVLIRKQ
jgi:uncharacterized membrane protein YcjF (UPF0283 family)